MSKKIPVMIGIILLAAAGFTIYNRSASSIFFVLAGLILVFSKEKSYKLFLQSFRSNVSICALVEMLNLVGFFGILLAASKYLEKSAAWAMEHTDFAALESAIAAKENIAAAESFFTSMLITSIIGLILFFALYTVTRYFIWKIMGYKRPFWKFVLTNLIWWLMWMPIMILVFIGARPEVAPYLFVLTMFLYLYFTFFVHFSYFNKQNVVRHSASLAFSNKFLVPLAYAFTIFVIVSQALRFQLAVGVVLIAVWLCWVRCYFDLTSKKR